MAPDDIKKGCVHLVAQRYRSCKLLLDEVEWTSQGELSGEKGLCISPTTDDLLESSTLPVSPSQFHCGLLLYVSFAAEADEAAVMDAAQRCLNLPILTLGLWGDGTSPLFSIQQCLLQSREAFMSTGRAISITIVPQANLICKVKSQGQSIQYHGQIDKDKGEALYSLFVDSIGAIVFERQCHSQQSNLGEPLVCPDWFTTWKTHRFVPVASSSTASIQQQSPAYPSSVVFDPSIPPAELFANDPTYSEIDRETGVPLTLTANGQPLTKSATKKLCKVLHGHTKRHDKWLRTMKMAPRETCLTAQTVSLAPVAKEAAVIPVVASSDVSGSMNNSPAASVAANAVATTIDSKVMDWDRILDASYCRVIAGTFGKRQGLEVLSDMGPFCHVMQMYWSQGG